MKESIQTDLIGLRKQFEADVGVVSDLDALATLRDKWLGRERGILSLEMKKLGTLPKELRPEQGRLLNQLKAEIEQTLDARLEQLKAKEAQSRLEQEKVDVTLPGYPYALGHSHPLRLVREEIESILVRMGFTVLDTPEIETEYYNFEALNIPPDHPARDEQDTFYISDRLLRTHCTTVQLHAMEKMQPPLRVISSGKVYRRDKPDATHSPVFHQLDGLVVDEGITMRDLKGTLEAFLKALFSPDTKVSFFPSYFPFVEPGADLAISCIFCRGAGCRKCKQSGWIELLGAGMVHPNVFKSAGYDSEKYTGFAWGMGIDRVAILKYGIEDIRLLFENDLRFLAQFP
jgi:phenylalanyl-tRNA synthetase alpha chain